MKKTKLIATLLTICLAISTLAYGVYAATNLSFTVGANISFEVDNLFIDADGFVYGYRDINGDEPTNTITLHDSTGANLEGTYKGIAKSIADNSSGQEKITTIARWEDLPDLYFNSSSLTSIVFRVEVANYTPNESIEVSIVPSNETASFFTTNNISTNSVEGTASAFNTTAEIAIATYSITLQNLATPITLSEIAFTVYINTSSKVTFNSNGGSPVAALNVTGENLSQPTNPTKTGYSFGGWYTDNTTFVDVVDWDNYAPTDATTLYAKWNPVNVVFNDGTNTTTVTYDNLGTQWPSNPTFATAPAATFLGWYTHGGNTAYTSASTFSGDTTLYARYTGYSVVKYNLHTGNGKLCTCELYLGSDVNTRTTIASAWGESSEHEDAVGFVYLINGSVLSVNVSAVSADYANESIIQNNTDTPTVNQDCLVDIGFWG